MTPQQLMDGLRDKNRLLTQKNDELLDLAEHSARKNMEHKTLFAKKMLELKQGHPVTILKSLCEGDKIVAQAKFEADVAEAVYKACRESINDIRTAVDTYRSLLSWEKEERFGKGV